VSPARDLTQLLVAWCGGEPSALDRLVPLVYAELHRISHRHLRGERPQHDLQTTAIVHEAYLRLVDVRGVKWENRAHFFAMAAQLVRHILVDAARERGAKKRGGDISHVELDEAVIPSPERGADLLALDTALTQFAMLDPRKAKVVELRYFGGLTVEETAEVLKVSPDTVMTDWHMAKLWLLRELAPEPGAECRPPSIAGRRPRGGKR
jgi:RNA polymerase sigma factor (TIGR02999 family)